MKIKTRRIAAPDAAMSGSPPANAGVFHLDGTVE
jgi:hypothetical protein